MIVAKQIDHVCLWVSSLTETQEYYRNLFGFECRPREHDPNSIIIESPYLHFFISESRELPFQFLRKQHLSFRVDDLDSVIENLHLRSIRPYETGTVDFLQQNYRWCEWRDPDGIRLECIQLLE